MRSILLAALLALALAGAAAAQGLPSLPNLPTLGGGGAAGGPAASHAIPGLRREPQTPEQRRAFCRRVAEAAMRCGLSLDVMALSLCVARTLPPEDSLRVAQAANTARGDASAVLGECGVGFSR